MKLNKTSTLKAHLNHLDEDGNPRSLTTPLRDFVNVSNMLFSYPSSDPGFGLEITNVTILVNRMVKKKQNSLYFIPTHIRENIAADPGKKRRKTIRQMAQ
jgi:hypothetical protein